jgi:hypothetical protein
VSVAAPFFAHREHFAIDLPGARALFTTRRGGFSGGPYSSLNLGRWTDDDPQAVERNRERVQQDLGVRFAYGRQVHGATVIRVTGEPAQASDPPESDGQLTALPGAAPMVLTADCLPIAVAAGGAVMMLHAGWRGLAAGIVGEGVAALRELTGDGHAAAAIGPGAGPCCYEVSDDVHAEFAQYGSEVRRGRNLDLKAVARRQLVEAGVSEVHDIGVCTICADPELSFSHRRDRGVTGRQAGVAWLT